MVDAIPTGERIADEIELEMQANLFPLRHARLAPAEYYVYLHQDDFDAIEGVIPRIVHDVQTCLNTLVERLNRPALLTKFVKVNQAAVEVPPGGWAVHIRPAVNQNVGRGEMRIHSRLSIPPASRFDGTGTVRIVQTVVTPSGRQTEVRSEPAPSPPPVPEPLVPRSGAHGELTYSDDKGNHTVQVTKELTLIGRGGPGHWVDVMLVAGTKISRLHCRIRRTADGRFVLQSLGPWGTSVDGEPLPPFTEGPSSRAAERELFDGSRIQLADAVTLVFSRR